MSHRSPLAPWKLLIRAIGCFYRREDVACREYLNGIQPESAPVRLIPAIKAMLGAEAKARLTPAAADLVARRRRISRRFGMHSRGWSGLLPPARLPPSLRTYAPQWTNAGGVHQIRLERLKQHITVRCALAHLDEWKVNAALGGACSMDAYFMRLFARGMEQSDDLEILPSPALRGMRSADAPYKRAGSPQTARRQRLSTSI